MYVADTNVISETDPEKSRTPKKLNVDRGAELFLTAVTIAELEAGVRKLERGRGSRKAEEFRRWLSEVERRFDGKILPFDHGAARMAGRIADRVDAQGHKPGWADIQIAAVAASRGLTVLTRNMRHFAPMGVSHLDPFADDGQD